MLTIPDELAFRQSYDPESGVITWVNPTRPRFRGKAAGCIDGGGYVTFGFQGKLYLAHRVAWFLMTGDQPPSKIDHRDGNPSNNRWCNLRLATDSQNCGNRRRSRDGLKGVRVHPTGRFAAQIMCAGVSHYLGVYDTEQEAADAYAAKAAELFGEFARTA